MSDLSNLTLDLFRGSFTREVIHKIPMFTMLYEHRRITSKGGTSISDAVIMNTRKASLQMYRPGEGLVVTDVSLTRKPSFNWKYGQLPVKVTCDEETQNELATSEVKRGDLVKIKVKEAHEGARQGFNTQFHATTAAGDSGTDFQSIPEAAGHSRTYGGLASDTTFSSMAWWGGASLDDSFADSATAMAISMSNFRKCKARCKRYVPESDRLYMFVPEDVASVIAGLAEAARLYTGSTAENSKLFKYGYDTFIVANNVEVVSDTYMTLNSMTTYMLLVNPNTFELRLHPSRAFQMTPFTRQDLVANGEDALMARIKVMGNLVCWQPNGNMVKSSVS